ncbi:type II toxin-antitoxin system HicA family toxin [Ornithobacterium rhinotracheale]
MSRKEKLIKRLCSLPKDFTFNELQSILIYLGFEVSNKGKTSGSRICFYHEKKDLKYLAHKPHPQNIIKPLALKNVVEFLNDNELLNIEKNEDTKA